MGQRSKRPYRAHSLERLDWSRIGEQVEGQQVIVGIDVAKEGMVAAVMVEGENVVKTVRWSHPKQTASWLAFVGVLRERSAGLDVAMEPSGVYGDALRWQLLEAGVAVAKWPASTSGWPPCA